MITLHIKDISYYNTCTIQKVIGQSARPRQQDAQTRNRHPLKISGKINLVFYLLLLVLIILVALRDLRRGRIPNWVTLPLLGIGLFWHFPGALEIWLVCLLLFAAWRAGWLGGGDAKLWMALLWIVPTDQAQIAALVMAGVFTLTALAQLLWRKFRKTPLTGVKSPSVWRAIPFAIWLCTVPTSGWLF